MAQLYEQLGVGKIKTSIYHPQANGLVERFNGTLKAMLKKFIGEHVQAWDRYLPYLLFAYRKVPCEIVKKNLKQARSKQKRVYDSQSSHRRLEVGDKPLVSLPSPGNKLEMRWQEPYAVTEV